LAIPGPELHSVRRETISMLGKTYGCGQCSGKYSCLSSQCCYSCLPPLYKHNEHVGTVVTHLILFGWYQAQILA
jgi:hypothetical protein